MALAKKLIVILSIVACFVYALTWLQDTFAEAAPAVQAWVQEELPQLQAQAIAFFQKFFAEHTGENFFSTAN